MTLHKKRQLQRQLPEALHKKRQPSDAAARDEVLRLFCSRALHSDFNLAALRKKHDSERLCHEESLALILEGNEEHIVSLRSFNVIPAARHERISGGRLDYLVIACSDSRIHRLILSPAAW